MKSHDTLFVDDLSFDKSKVINMLRSFHSAFGTKTIVYTDSIDSKYLNGLWLSNVSSILHNRETPLLDFFNRFKKESKTALKNGLYGKESARYFDTGKKFIDTIRLINRGCDCYDELVTSIILGKHIWAKRENGYDSSRSYINLSEAKQEYKSKGNNLPSNITAGTEVLAIINQLSEREKEILLQIAEGHKNKEIAGKLFISADKVVKHKSNMIKKLELKSVNELFILAIQYKDLLIGK